MEEIKQLTPLQDQIINKTIENITRKLVAGHRNKRELPQNGDVPGIKSTVKNTIKASSAKDALEVANRGGMWKEMMSKTFSHGISSLSSLQFDSEFTIKDGVAKGLNDISNSPGVYVVYDASGNIRYIGDSENVQKRWVSGHLNENTQKEKNGESYKLNSEFTEGCVVKVIECESKETAAALEASLIEEARSSDEYNVVNEKEELKNKQGTRSNIEAQKLKDKIGSAANLASGAATEAAKNGAWLVFEQALTDCIQALKNEIVDFFISGEINFTKRIKRLLTKVIDTLRKQLSNIKGMLKGVFEFVLNACSQAISQIYQLAKNIFDLGMAAWHLFKNRKTMSKDELITKITETIVVSVNVTFWASIDLTLETQLTTLIGPAAPFVAAFISALGFGLSSHYLSEFVPKIVDFIIGGYDETKAQLQESAKLIVESSKLNTELVSSLGDYMHSTADLIKDIQLHNYKLNTVSTRNVSIRDEIEF